MLSEERSHAARVTLARDAARDHLLGLRSAAGWWKGEVESNVTMEAEDLLVREFLGVRAAEPTEETARWIRLRQQDDGTWAIFHGGPPELSTTVEAYVALRLAGDSPEASHMKRAAASIRHLGGVAACRVFTRAWLAMFGLWSWDDLPVMPPELMFLPGAIPLNLYDWAPWARQTIVPLTIITSVRPVRPLPFGVAELIVPAPARPATARPAQNLPATAAGTATAGIFIALDRALHSYGRRPVPGVRRAALRRAAEWILARQETDGLWGGLQPSTVYSLIALRSLGYDIRHAAVRRGIEGLDRLTIRTLTPAGAHRRLETCQSQVWDTAIAICALTDAGLPGDHPDIVDAARWLADRQVRSPGDWSVRRPGLPGGGWAFGFGGEGYPDIDDTAMAVLALGRVRAPGLGPATGRGLRWLAGMQSPGGGYAAFEAGVPRELCTRPPFCDFGEVIDRPCADVTAHAVEALATGRPHATGGQPATGVIRGAVSWLLGAQESDGSWPGRWGVNHVYGTGAVVSALIAAGVPVGRVEIRRAVRWLEEHQDPGGGWGEDPRSYDDPGWRGRGSPTASQTAWALIALIRAGRDGRTGQRSPPVARGIDWLIENQRPDGGWDENEFTATGFPGDFYFKFGLYPVVFPLSALGRYAKFSRWVET